MPLKKILIIGSFYHPANKNHSVTAAEQLAAILKKHHVGVITTTRQYKKIQKLIATVYAILVYSRHYDIAVVPLYGTPLSFIWQSVSVQLLKLLKKKVVLVVHGGSIPEQVEHGQTKFIKTLHRANAVVCPSPYMQTFLSGKGIQSTVIENGLDLSSYPHQQKTIFRPHLLWMRSFSDTYNPEMAVRVAIVLAQKYPDFKMVMAGTDGGTLQRIVNMVQLHQLDQVISLPGYLDHAQKIKYAEACDIYISTNRIDNAPVSLIEFMALGLPIVAVNTGGIPYLIKDGYNGLLTEPEDAEAMAKKIEMLIGHPELSKTICGNAYAYSAHYGEEAVFRKWQNFFGDLNKSPSH